uniref:Uncharacterized protein n=1 Tax=Ciona intestinalis TaxID=7719 RepID=H2Y1Q7_CIOIN
NQNFRWPPAKGLPEQTLASKDQAGYLIKLRVARGCKYFGYFDQKRYEDTSNKCQITIRVLQTNFWSNTLNTS